MTKMELLFEIKNATSSNLLISWFATNSKYSFQGKSYTILKIGMVLEISSEMSEFLNINIYIYLGMKIQFWQNSKI